MTEPRHPEMNPGPDADIERMLVGALSTRALPAGSLERLRTAVAQEWHATTGKPKARVLPIWRLRWVAVAAAAAFAAVAMTFLVASPSTQVVPIGSVSRLADGGLEVRSGLFRHRTLVAGDTLRVGDRFTTRSSALVTLIGGGTLRIAADSRVSFTSPTLLSLERGLIYLDFPPKPPSSRPFRVGTRAGEVEHLGTEFEVMSDDQTVRVRVREGRILFLGKSNTLVAGAGTELLAAPGNKISQRPIATYGRDWLWVAALAPDYEIEGQPLLGFLLWASRELGCRLEFADASAREIADRTVLHGSVQGRAPVDALSNVLATTSLSYEIRDETLWVRSGS